MRGIEKILDTSILTIEERTLLASIPGNTVEDILEEMKSLRPDDDMATSLLASLTGKLKNNSINLTDESEKIILDNDDMSIAQ